jgi:hypothetical protein
MAQAVRQTPHREDDRPRLSEFASAKLRRRYAKAATPESKARDQAIMGERDDDD